MRSLREHLDVLTWHDLSEDDQRHLAHMVLNHMYLDLEEWCNQRSVPRDQLDRWIAAGVIAGH